MFPLETFRATLEKLTNTLQRHRIRFHLTGGVTSATYGEPRLTQDIDVVVDPDQLRAVLEEFLQDLQTANFIFDGSSVRNAIQTGGMFQLLDAVEALKLDVYPREMIPGELNRSATAEIFAGTRLPIVCRTDAAIAKLIWISKGSHKSRRDLRKLFKTSSVADQGIIHSQATEFQLDELLQTVLAESDEIS